MFLNEWNQSLKLQEQFAVQRRASVRVSWSRRGPARAASAVGQARWRPPAVFGSTAPWRRTAAAGVHARRRAAHQTGGAVAQAAPRAGRRPGPAGTPRRRERGRGRRREEGAEAAAGVEALRGGRASGSGRT